MLKQQTLQLELPNQFTRSAFKSYRLTSQPKYFNPKYSPQKLQPIQHEPLFPYKNTQKLGLSLRRYFRRSSNLITPCLEGQKLRTASFMKSKPMMIRIDLPQKKRSNTLQADQEGWQLGDGKELEEYLF